MKSNIIRLILSVSSFSGIILFLIIGKKTSLSFFIMPVFIGGNLLFIKYLLCVLLVILFARLALWSTKFLSYKDSVEVKTIYPMESTFLPTYIGLFVAALSLENSFSIESGLLLLILFIFWIFLDNVSYFNPFFLLFGYRFYEVVSKENKKFTVITKRRDLKDIEKFDFLIRISNFSYIEK